MPNRSFERPEDRESSRVCYCMHVHEATIRRAIRSGVTDLEELLEATRAGTGCGTCRFDLIAMLREETATQRPEEERA